MSKKRVKSAKKSVKTKPKAVQKKEVKPAVVEQLGEVKQEQPSFIEYFYHTPIQSLKNSSSLLADLREGNHPLYRLIFVGIFIFFLILMPLLSFHYGMTWDEPVNVEYAEDIYNYYRTGGADKVVFDEKARHARDATMHYGASFDFFAYLIQKTISPFGVYETRHLLNALVGVLIALFVGRIGKELGNWRLACLAMLFVLISPRFFGHSMNNHKDIPFMLGYAMAIYYLIRFIRQLPQPRISTMLWLSIGIAYAISIRIGGLLLLAYLVLFFGLSWLIQLVQDKEVAIKRLPKYLVYGLCMAVFAYFLGIALWPFGIEAPFSNPFVSLAKFTDFNLLTTYEIFNGERILMFNPPWDYLPKWIWISTPLVVLFGLLLSIPHAIHKFKQQDKFVLFLLGFTAVFPIAYVIYQGSTLYSGWRHALFVYAPLVVLAAFGWEYLFQISKKKILVGLVTGSLVLLMGLPITWMVKNHPNQYVYFNEMIGGINGAYTNYETEYWCNAAREGIEWIIENEPIQGKKVVVATNFETNALQYYADKKTDNIEVIWVRENQRFLNDWDYAVFGSRTLSKEAIQNTFPPKGTIYAVKADTVPLAAVVKRENKALPQAFALQKRRQLIPAMEKAREAVAYEPKNLEALRLKGTLHLKLGQYDSALVVLKKCVALNPDDYGAYNLMGTSYRVKKQLDDALKVLNKAIELRSNNPGAYHEKGLVNAKMGSFQEAYRNFEKALTYSQHQNPSIIYDVATVLIKHGQLMAKNTKDPNRIKKRDERYRGAIKYLKRTLALNPKDRRAINDIAYAYLQLKDTANYYRYAKLLQEK